MKELNKSNQIKYFHLQYAISIKPNYLNHDFSQARIERDVERDELE